MDSLKYCTLSNGNNLLMLLSSIDDPKLEEIVRIMCLYLQFDLNQVDNEGNTALILACKSGCSQVANQLIKSGAHTTANVKNKQGNNALNYACQRSGFWNDTIKFLAILIPDNLKSYVDLVRNNPNLKYKDDIISSFKAYGNSLC